MTSCSLKDEGCAAEALIGPQTDVVLETASPFVLTAAETIAAGHLWTFCYECTVTPVGGLPTIKFTKDSLTVSQTALDCSSSLADAGF